jgi:L-fuculose-phosphate aldolase
VKINKLSPREQVREIMVGIYNKGMTTPSGGNISAIDENGDMWITPSGIDKGSLTSEDIVCVTKDGEKIGKNKPSSEYPFHRAVYDSRSDIKAIVHAHPISLVAFSALKQLPNMQIVSHGFRKQAGFAKYALPGSEKLGKVVAEEFKKGKDIVIMENHALVAGGENMFDAYASLETIELFSNIQMNAGLLDDYKPEKKDQKDKSDSSPKIKNQNSQSINQLQSLKTLTQRQIQEYIDETEELCKYIQRSYQRGLFTCSIGIFSLRIDKNNFLVNAPFADRGLITPEELMLIDSQTDLSQTKINYINELSNHREIYKKHSDINCIVTALPPNVMAFGVSHKELNVNVLPESIVFLRSVNKITYDQKYKEKVNILSSPEKRELLAEVS